jgi:hypothetical protein
VYISSTLVSIYAIFSIFSISQKSALCLDLFTTHAPCSWAVTTLHQWYLQVPDLLLFPCRFKFSILSSLCASQKRGMSLIFSISQKSALCLDLFPTSEPCPWTLTTLHQWYLEFTVLRWCPLRVYIPDFVHYLCHFLHFLHFSKKCPLPRSFSHQRTVPLGCHYSPPVVFAVCCSSVVPLTCIHPRLCSPFMPFSRFFRFRLIETSIRSFSHQRTVPLDSHHTPLVLFAVHCSSVVPRTFIFP